MNILTAALLMFVNLLRMNVTFLELDLTDTCRKNKHSGCWKYYVIASFLDTTGNVQRPVTASMNADSSAQLVHAWHTPRSACF